MKCSLSRNKLMGVMAAMLYGLMACVLTFPAFSPTEIPVPDATPIDSPLYAQVTLTSVAAHEEGQRPNYTIDSQTPILEGNDDARVEVFNELMHSIVQDEVDVFKSWMENMPAESIAGGSFLGIDFAQVAPYGSVISIKFTIAFYSDGAAHPGQYSRTVTYDLESGTEILLEQVFLPEMDYLKIIATYSIAELRSRDIGFDDLWMSGAEATTENYCNWNITGDGLLITFDPYQVAPYAAGPQEVVVPYDELSTILDPNGPLANILP